MSTESVSETGMTEEDRRAKVGGSVDSSAIQTGTGNTATITITNYYYREDTTVFPIESTEAADEDLPCPYRGLFHFGPDDAEYFFGREVFVEELFEATQTRNFIPVLGASGSGKSSVVLAGLVPKLQNDGHWQFTHFRPGSDPFQALALALVPLYTQNLDATDKIIQARKLAQSLGEGEIPLADVFAQIHQNHPTNRVLLIADQFEEIYTLCTAADLLEEALASADLIKDSNYKAEALNAIAIAIVQLNQPETAAGLLEKALASADLIKDSNYKAEALIAIAVVYGQLNQPETAADLLEEALASADLIKDSNYKAEALNAIAIASANLKNWGQALKAVENCSSQDCEVNSLTEVLTIHAEQQRPELKKEEGKEEE